MKKSILTTLISISSVFNLTASAGVQTVFPVNSYSTITIGRIASKPYLGLSVQAQVAARYKAKSQAIPDCDLAAKIYAKSHRPPVANSKNYKDFMFVQNPNTKISPEFGYMGKEYMEMMPIPTGELKPHYVIDFYFYCNGRWIDMNPGRHN